MSQVKTKHYADQLVGKTVALVRSLHKEEMEMMAWYESSNPTCVLIFTDGTYAIVTSDPEENDTGFLAIGQTEMKPIIID